MRSIAQKLKVLFPDLNLDPIAGECLVVRDEDGTRIEVWNRPEPEPTQEELDAVTDQDVDDDIANRESDFELQFDPLFKAFALTLLDEINTLRTDAGLPVRTIQQFKQAVKNKM